LNVPSSDAQDSEGAHYDWAYRARINRAAGNKVQSNRVAKVGSKTHQPKQILNLKNDQPPLRDFSLWD
jgi:hypothetical protein